jgi:beta propeller repeat protein
MTIPAGDRTPCLRPAGGSDQYIVWVDDGAIRARSRSGGQHRERRHGDQQVRPGRVRQPRGLERHAQREPDIFGRDLAGGQELPIATSPATEAYPDCDDSRVVYMSTSATTGVDISLFDRTTGATTVVSAQPWNEWIPAISGSRVVWQAWPNQPNCCIQIKGIDLSTGAPIPVTSGSGNQLMPDVSEAIVVWQDERNTNPEVCTATSPAGHRGRW